MTKSLEDKFEADVENIGETGVKEVLQTFLPYVVAVWLFVACLAGALAILFQGPTLVMGILGGQTVEEKEQIQMLQEEARETVEYCSEYAEDNCEDGDVPCNLEIYDDCIRRFDWEKVKVEGK